MANKGPKTLRGVERKMMTGDGRKSTPTEKAMKDMNKTAKEAQEMLFGGKRKQQRKRRSN